MSVQLVENQEHDILPGFGSKQSFDLALRAANLLSKSTLVPQQYQNNIPNCVIALNMSARMQADPLMVMQNLYIVQGRPGWSSQFLISTFNTCGRFSALRYEWVSKEGSDEWGCRAWATEIATGEKLSGSTVTISIAKKEGWHSKNGSKWQTMPQQMLMYRAAAWFVRAYAPELAMGMKTEFELQDIDEERTVEGEVARDIATKANATTIDVQPGTQAEDAKSEAATTEQPEPKDALFEEGPKASSTAPF